ncbi:unnamed protein product [Dicrocoelium dendriticum]|nr:unnamed protein product [Dicrocoelium dendriticum]
MLLIKRDSDQGSGPIPIAFLAGSPRHTLSPSELESTLAYLREADPDHLYSFLDICVRNAVSPGGVRQSTHLVNLIRALTSREDSFNLKDICTVPTINAVTEFIKRCPNIPSDVKEQLSGLDKHWITSIR